MVTKKQPAKPVYIDEHAVNETILYGANEYDLYQNLYIDWYNNFAQKRKTGRFDKELAIKGLAQNYVPMIIMKYNKTFGRGSITLNAAEKVEVAKHFYDRLFRDFGLKNIRKDQNFVKRHR